MTIKIKIMVKAFRIRIAAGETFDEAAASYPKLTKEELAEIKAALEE